MLLRSRISDLGSHLRITVAPEEDNAKDGKLSHLTKSTLSMNAGKPVMFVLDGGARTEFWTKGFLYNPCGPAVHIRTQNRESTHYNDSDGISHRIDGPAEAVYVLDSGGELYEEYWREHGGMHRDVEPASTRIARSKSEHRKWDDIIATHEWDQYLGAFPKNTPIKYSTAIDKEWFKHGEPYRNGDLPSVVHETGVVEVMQLSELLGMKTTKLCIRREYTWRIDGHVRSRANGPAVVKLFGAYDVTKNGKLVEQSFEDIQIEWYFNGDKISNGRIDAWVKENDIKIGEAPYVTTPYFATPEDEVCFITEFL